MNQTSYYARSDAASAGAVLAAAREELNLSVSDVARHLKLSPAQVEALEEGAYDKLPGRVFVRGFLRNYAKLLGVDPQPLLRRIEHEMPKPKAVEEPPPAPQAVMPTGERSHWPVYFGVAGTIIAALAAYEFGFNNPPDAAEDESKSVPVQPAPTASASAPEAASAAPAPAVSAAPSSPSGAASGTPLDPGLSVAVPAQKTAAAPGERQLQFKFDVESWVEIRDGTDKVIFSKLNRAGAEERVSGTPPFKLVVGNARGVRLTYDEKPVDLTPHIGVTVARLTLQ
ncbi:MAG TPA: RodZ domain-containing protein [Burkholderiales bacterium]|nr:RodZ domain-containing protein [Burkholderiales bacterium]